jgi:hypothetical protein
MGKEGTERSSLEFGALDTVYLGCRESTSSWCKCRVIRQIGVQYVEAYNGVCTNQYERRWQVCEKDDDTEVLKLRERQLHNIPEELGWWYRVDSKTVGRICNRCECCREREEWDLYNWRSQVDTETKVAACINCIERTRGAKDRSGNARNTNAREVF